MIDRYDDKDPFEDDLDTCIDEFLMDPQPDLSEAMAGPDLKYKGRSLRANEIRFRPLRADEIDVRLMGFRNVGGKNEGRLYLYQKARVPAQILDETVGPLNWQVSYGTDINRCTISIYDDFHGYWVSKENVGTESDLESEKDKSTASDAFKRAASYWGIGRELYSAGDIITSKLKIVNNNKEGYNNPAFFRCYDKFEVSDIQYDDQRRITHIEIRNITQNVIAYKR